jgi:hypothetical protein
MNRKALPWPIKSWPAHRAQPPPAVVPDRRLAAEVRLGVIARLTDKHDVMGTGEDGQRRASGPWKRREKMMSIPGTTAQAQQVSIPTSAADVPGPPSGNVMTEAYVQTVGRMAYIWGWPLVNMANRFDTFSEELPAPMVLGGLPIGVSGIAMLTDYISPEQHAVTCPNQDVVYGSASSRWIRGRSSSRFRISVIASGSMRSMTRAPTRSPRSASRMAPNPASTFWSAPAGRAQRQRASRRWCGLPRRWCMPFRGSSWTTRRRIGRPSDR